MDAPTDKARILRFGVFEVDVRAGELRKNGLKIKLQEKPFQILVLLLNRPGDVVTREELQKQLWASDTFVDFEHGVNTALTKLRHALGDDPNTPRFIETLPRRGYRFIGSINGRTEIPAAPSEPDAPMEQARSRRFFRRAIVPAAALTLVAAAAVWKLDLLRPHSPPHVESLAVLPLANLSGNPEQEYFADGMTEELITELSRIGSLKVISRTSVMQYKGEKKKTLSQIGRELHVDAVMEGSVLRSGDRVRIAAHMIYAPTDQPLMSETYERDLGDVLKLQREVAESITQQVRLKLTPEQQARLHEAREVAPEAFEAYLRATSIDTWNPQGNKLAQGYIHKALEKDPGFADAYVALAQCYVDLVQFRWISPRDAYTPLKLAARKALELDEKNCEAHSELAWLSWRLDWDWASADREFEQALQLCPNSASIHWDHAYYAGWNEHGADALAEMEKTRELDPLFPPFLLGKALINYHLRDYKALTDVGREYVASRPNAWISHYLLGVGLEGAGQPAGAIPEYQKAVELSQGDQDPIAALAHAYASSGRRADAQKILREWQRQSETSYVSPYMIATVYASLVEKNKAFEYLEKAYREKSSDLPYFLKADLRVDSLRSDPRFQNLLRRMNFPK